MVTGVFGRELFQDLDEQRLDEGAVHRDLAHVDGDHLVALANGEDDALEGGGLLSRLLQPLEGLAARVELAAGARDETAGLHVVDLDALLALGRKAELGLGFEPVGLGEGAQQHLAVADGDWAFVERALAGFAAVERVADRSPGRDEEFDAALAAVARRACCAGRACWTRSPDRRSRTGRTDRTTRKFTRSAVVV